MIATNHDQASRTFYFTTSWDDGSVHDIRLSELLLRHGVKGTFYIPVKNMEIAATLDAGGVRQLSRQFEIGGHAYSHRVLTSIPIGDARDEIAGGKKALEDMIGAEVSAFCFPRGKFNQALVESVIRAGFLFARTVKNLKVKNVLDIDNRLMHVSLQAYPHRSYVYFISALKGNSEARINYARFGVALSHWGSGARKFFTYACRAGGTFHLWGHSWEIEKHNLWGMLDDFLAYVKSQENVVYCTNTELWRMSKRRDF